MFFSYVAVVIDTDGSAFITKAEFDSLKNNFQAQIDNYNNSIDSKIDGAIAAYLAGVTVAQELQYYYDKTKTYKFKNNMEDAKQKPDRGLYNITHQRLAGIKALVGLSSDTVELVQGSGGTIVLVFGDSMTDDDWRAERSYSSMMSGFNAKWESNIGAKMITLMPQGGGKIMVPPGWTNATTMKNDIKAALDDAGLGDTYLTGMKWSYVLSAFLVKFFSPSQIIMVSVDGTGRYNFKGGWTGVGGTSDNIERRNSINIYTSVDNTRFGAGWLVNQKQGRTWLSDWSPKISIMNTYDMQNFTYKDASTQTTSAVAWNDTSNIGLAVAPDLNFDTQDSATSKIPADTSSTSASEKYWSYQAAQIKFIDNTLWDSESQLGTLKFSPTMRCFDNACVLDHGSVETILADTLKFNRTGYYKSGSTLVTKNNNYVQTGNVDFTPIIWKSDLLSAQTIALDGYTSTCGETVFLGGGVPLVLSPSELSGMKLSLNWAVKKADGTALTTTDPNLNVTIEISNKQFSNGNLSTGARSLGVWHSPSPITYTNNSGTLVLNNIDLFAKEKIWINAKIEDTDGYTVELSNIEIK